LYKDEVDCDLVIDEISDHSSYDKSSSSDVITGRDHNYAKRKLNVKKM
jgi:hypothetical protein